MPHGRQIHMLACREIHRRQIIGVDENHAAFVFDATIAIVPRIDRGVILIMGAKGCERKNAILSLRLGCLARSLGGQACGNKIGFAGRRFPNAFFGRVA